MDKKTENGYFLVKCKSDSYTLHYFHHIGRGVIKSDELVCDVVCLNPFAYFKQWYTLSGGEMRKKNVRLNTVILTKVEVQSINDVALPDRA